MEWWKHGKLEQLISECEAIQKRLKRSVKTKKQSDQKAFCCLMLQGQVKMALRFVDHGSDIDRKHDITTDITKKLKEKHPKAAKLKQSAIIDRPETKTERVIFVNITQDEIASNTKHSSGSGGPTQIDMDTWRETICSKSYGTLSKMLADEIATLARSLETDTVPHDYISTPLACRLVPLKKKDNGIRPVGVGECLQRINGKTTTGLLEEDIIHAVGTLQTCVGLESGIEAAIHAVKKSFEEHNSECMLLVDADNAFNKLNRKVSLENIKRLCPQCTHTYTTATTHPPLLSQERVTQEGDNAAMAMYALSPQPLIQALSSETANDEVKQVWYADDSSAIGSLAGVKKWWEYLQDNGPDFGYCPKPAKTILLIKDSSLMQSAQKIFKNDGIKITDQGERRLGSVIGTESFREQYIKNKVQGGEKDLHSLSTYAQDDPQAAYSVFTKGISSR